MDTMSFPGMLKFMQEQWDTQVLEVYQLKQTLEATRKELSHALYQHEAACNVILRYENEKQELLAQLDQNKVKFDEMKKSYEEAHDQMQTKAYQETVTEETKQKEIPTTLSQELIKRMNDLSDQLIEERRQMKAPDSYPQREQMS